MEEKVLTVLDDFLIFCLLPLFIENSIFKQDASSISTFPKSSPQRNDTMPRPKVVDPEKQLQVKVRAVQRCV